MVQKTHSSQKIFFSLLAGFALIALNLTSVRAEVKLQSGNFNVLAESTFDTSTEGWGIINDGTAPVYYAAGGESGGYIQSKIKVPEPIGIGRRLPSFWAINQRLMTAN